MTNQRTDRWDGRFWPSVMFSPPFLHISTSTLFHWSPLHFLMSSHRCRAAVSSTHLSAARLCVILLLPASLHVFLPCLSSPSLPPHQLFKSIKFTGDNQGHKKSRKRLISQIRKEWELNVKDVKCRKITYLPCTRPFFPALISHLQSCRA